MNSPSLFSNKNSDCLIFSAFYLKKFAMVFECLSNVCLCVRRCLGNPFMTGDPLDKCRWILLLVNNFGN